MHYELRVSLGGMPKNSTRFQLTEFRSSFAFGVWRGRSRRVDLGDSRRVRGAHGEVTGSWEHIHCPKNGVIAAIADNADAKRRTPNE
ncbi:MAG TPA: hypothetical protein VE242_05355, partial [Chthoniobacterales bacterium]|nr:hypothetical protein [Chthoniobacterales bacterium]